MRDPSWKNITVFVEAATIITIFIFVIDMTSMEQPFNLLIAEAQKDLSVIKQLDTQKLMINNNIPIIKFRSYPLQLSESDVKAILKEHDFYCGEYSWSKKFCNPKGKGFDNDYVLQKNGQVVYDRNSGLMWQQSGSNIHYTDKYYVINEFVNRYIKKLNTEKFADFNDWRLPTLEEAMSLMDPLLTTIGEDMNFKPGPKYGHLFIESLFNKEQICICTSDQLKGAPGRQWIVNFSSGSCYCSYFSFYVRAVRFGQSDKSD